MVIKDEHQDDRDYDIEEAVRIVTDKVNAHNAKDV